MPVPSASVRPRSGDRPRSSATSAASRQASTETMDPASTGTTCEVRIATSSGIGAGPPNSAIGIAARSEGSGSQTSNAGRGKTSGGVPKLHRASDTRPRPSTRLRAAPT